MKPIEKNIIVVDENGNEYEATYPKRAKGLVKNGRARFIDENKICIVCPPINLEEKSMSENNTNNITNQSSSKLSINYALEQIELITKQTEYLYSVLEKLREIDPSAGQNDMTGRSKAEALATVVKCRETTNQQIIKFYEKVYSDLYDLEFQKNDKFSEIQKLTNLLNNTKPDMSPQAFSILADTIDKYIQKD